jgi:peptidylglycine monooxygenase
MWGGSGAPAATANNNDEIDGGGATNAKLKVGTTDLEMPAGVEVKRNDTYLCASFRLNTVDTHYLVGFDPLVGGGGASDSHHSQHGHGGAAAHHVLLFGCEAPGSERAVWNCGEMGGNIDGGGDEALFDNGAESRASPCASQPDILYAWAHNAPALKLPAGVAFRVGAETRNRFLVLQVHYMHPPSVGESAQQGVRVHSTVEPQPKTAATLLMVTGGTIPAHSLGEQLEVACVVDEPVALHPFAFRVHTHAHGRAVSGWVVREHADGRDEWLPLGERDPQRPQLFEPVAPAVAHSMVVREGDVLAARCTMRNEEDRDIAIGARSSDEMCNYYLMYWVDGERTLARNTCFSPGAPDYRWSRDAGLNHIPKAA